MNDYKIIISGGAFAGGVVGAILLWLIFNLNGFGFNIASFYFLEKAFLLLCVFGGIMTSLTLYHWAHSKNNKRITEKHAEENKAKGDFISMIISQIKTPLTGMVWYTKELSEEATPGNKQKKRIQKLHEETTRLLTTVEKLLKVSHENTGRTSYYFEIYSSSKLERLISESISRMKAEAYDKNISVEIDASPLSKKLVKIDKEKIIAVAQTLFENAIHYTKPGGTIKITMGEKSGIFVFSVSDTGIGIPLNEQPKIFTQFYRAKNAKRILPEGLGVGLYIAKSFVEAHEGTLSFISNSKGATFTVKIPLFELSPEKPDKKESVTKK